MKTVSLVLSLLLCLSFYLNAKFTQTSVLSCMTANGWSKQFKARVTYVSGSELNEKGIGGYWEHSIYALLVSDKNEVLFIKLSSCLPCGSEVQAGCILGITGDLEGTDQKGKTWKICARSYCY